MIAPSCWSRLRLVVPTVFVALTACGARAAAPMPSATMMADTLRLEDVRSIIMAVGVPTLMARVSKPEPYLNDLVGAHALQRVAKADLLADFVPRHATLIEDTPQRVRLQFRTGPRVDFYFNTLLYLDANPLRVSYARIHLAQPSSYPAEAEAFRAILRSARLEEKYLVRNPYYSAEQRVQARMADSMSIAPVPVARDTAGFKQASQAVLLVGETHGTREAYDKVSQWLTSPQVDWLGMEMLSEDMQPTLETFLKAAQGSAAFRTAREQLVRYYAEAWNTREIERTSDPAQNPYFRLLELARQQRKAVYALDAPLLYTVFRWGEFPLGATTRDYIWSANIPSTGRGIVYGGSSHFLAARRPNFLTFLRERYPGVRFFTAP